MRKFQTHLLCQFKDSDSLFPPWTDTAFLMLHSITSKNALNLSFFLLNNKKITFSFGHIFTISITTKWKFLTISLALHLMWLALENRFTSTTEWSGKKMSVHVATENVAAITMVIKINFILFASSTNRLRFFGEREKDHLLWNVSFA